MTDHEIRPILPASPFPWNREALNTIELVAGEPYHLDLNAPGPPSTAEARAIAEAEAEEKPKSAIMLSTNSYCNVPAHEATREEVLAVPTPQGTRSWRPISNAYLMILIERELKGQGFEITQVDYALSMAGQQMFTVWHLQHENREDISGMFSVRQSTNKTLSIMLASGLSINVCTNLCVFGASVKRLRRHTTNVERDLDGLVKDTVQGIHQSTYHGERFMDELLRQPESLTDGYRTLGEMVGKEILLPRQASVAYKEWQEPRHEEFSERNAWSLYNACTEGLKLGRPAVRIPQGRKVSEFFRNCYAN